MLVQLKMDDHAARRSLHGWCWLGRGEQRLCNLGSAKAQEGLLKQGYEKPWHVATILGACYDFQCSMHQDS